MKRVGRGVWNKEHEIKGPEGSQDVIRVELQNLKIKFELCWLGRATVRSPCEFSYSLLPVNSWITARKSVACARHAPCAIYHGRTDDRVLRSRRFLPRCTLLINGFFSCAPTVAIVAYPILICIVLTAQASGCYIVDGSNRRTQDHFRKTQRLGFGHKL
jgi:hypothetical protein